MNKLKTYNNILDKLKFDYVEEIYKIHLPKRNFKKYLITISNGKNKITFDYQCITDNEPTLEKCLTSLFFQDENDTLIKMILSQAEIDIVKSILAWK